MRSIGALLSHLLQLIQSSLTQCQKDHKLATSDAFTPLSARLSVKLHLESAFPPFLFRYVTDPSR
ncbi:hypothetical protein ccbrp13_35820 [Ktedonobacteria bacterium brp13]|nr:hypothetical protein ccbrp13_35820 [Ktedonobacteria bacterium brp13]